MSRQEPKKKPAATPANLPQRQSSIARSGSGAGTALVAMLKRRQMRASGDVEQDPPSPYTAVRKPGKD